MICIKHVFVYQAVSTTDCFNFFCTEFVVKVPEKLRCILKTILVDGKHHIMQLRLVVYVPVDLPFENKYVPYSSSRDLVLDPASDLFGALSDLYSDNQARSL